MKVTSEMIKELRELTGAGVLDCKKALESANGDMARAQEILREKGLTIAAKKAEREAKEGLVESYVHMGKIGALVELNCETDFVARLPEFKQLAHDLAMQVVATRPRYLKPEDIPPEVVEDEKGRYRALMADQNKPAHVLDKIIENKLQKFYAEVCLLDQPFIKDENRTVRDVISEKIAATGENIVLRRFVRLELGEP
nr:translation elongation factor Ts [Chloroflexota bacterium]